MHAFVYGILTVVVVAGALLVTALACAYAFITLDPPDRQQGVTSGAAPPVPTRPESRAAALPAPSVTLDPPVDQTDEFGLASTSPITDVERPERADLPRSPSSVVEQPSPDSSSSLTSSPPPATPVPASPAASIQPPPTVPASPAEPSDQDKNRGKGRERNNRQDRWTGDKTGYRDGADRADKVERPEKIQRPEKIERVDRVERVELVRPERVEKVERFVRPERVEKVERRERVEKPERGRR